MSNRVKMGGSDKTKSDRSINFPVAHPPKPVIHPNTFGNKNVAAQL
jgi:hypothetical protein